MFLKRLMWIVWPAFLVAGALEMLVFALVDPQDLQWAGQPLDMSRQGIYTVAFFAFWALTLIASGLTAMLAMPPDEVNKTESTPDRADQDATTQVSDRV